MSHALWSCPLIDSESVRPVLLPGEDRIAFACKNGSGIMFWRHGSETSVCHLSISLLDYASGFGFVSSPDRLLLCSRVSGVLESHELSFPGDRSVLVREVCRVHELGVGCVSFYPYSATVWFVLRSDGALVRVSAASGPVVVVVAESACPLHGRVSFGPDEQIAFLSEPGTHLVYWSAAASVSSSPVDLKAAGIVRERRVTCVAVHPSVAALVAIGSTSGCVYLVGCVGGDRWCLYSRMHWHRSHVRDVAFSEAGANLFSCGAEPVLVRWRLNDVTSATRRRPAATRVILTKSGVERDFLPHLPSALSAITLLRTTGDLVLTGSLVQKVSVRLRLLATLRAPTVPQRRGVVVQMVATATRVYATSVPAETQVQVLRPGPAGLEVDGPELCVDDHFVSMTPEKAVAVGAATPPRNLTILFAVDAAERVLVCWQCWKQESAAIKVFDAQTNQCRRTVVYPRGLEKAVAMAIAAESLWIAYDSGAVERWALDDDDDCRVTERRRSGGGPRVSAITCSARVCVAGLLNGDVVVFGDAEGSGGLIKGAERPVVQVNLVGDNKFVVVHTRHARLFHTESMTELTTLAFDDECVAASGLRNGNVCMLMNDRRIVKLVINPTGMQVEIMVANTNNCTAFVATDDGTCLLFHPENGFAVVAEKKNSTHEPMDVEEEEETAGKTNTIIHQEVWETGDQPPDPATVGLFTKPIVKDWPPPYLMPNLEEFCIDVMEKLLV